MHSQQEILKTDALGRVRTTPQRREALLDEFFKSGVSANKFAQMTGINYQTFATWVQKRRRATGVYPPASDSHDADKAGKHCQWSLVEAVPVDEGSHVGKDIPCRCNALQVHLPGEVRFELTNTAQVELAVQLIKSLHRSC